MSEAPCPSCGFPRPGWAEGSAPPGPYEGSGCGTCGLRYWRPVGEVKKRWCGSGQDHDAHPWRGYPSPTADYEVAFWCDGEPDPLSVPISEETFEVEVGGTVFTTDLIEVWL